MPIIRVVVQAHADTVANRGTDRCHQYHQWEETALELNCAELHALNCSVVKLFLTAIEAQAIVGRVTGQLAELGRYRRR